MHCVNIRLSSVGILLCCATNLHTLLRLRLDNNLKNVEIFLPTPKCFLDKYILAAQVKKRANTAQQHGFN